MFFMIFTSISSYAQITVTAGSVGVYGFVFTSTSVNPAITGLDCAIATISQSKFASGSPP